jgi:5-methylcytosine-specific restriction enzyme subunit McrC
LLLIHYISLLERLVSTGLKKDYITIIENLKGKIKGQILFSQQLPQNIIPKREYRTVCRYQTYTEDIPANRLLKKALLFARKMLQIWMQRHSSYRKIQSRINKLLVAFTNVSEDIDVLQVQHLQNNKLFKTYPEAIRVAKMILMRFDYSVSNISEYNHTTPPFWIDMSRLYEMYVLNILRERYGKNILFQVSGYRGCKADYLHVGEKIIIDAKYKPRYNYSNEGILPDIREISGYARDKRILRSLDAETDEKEVKCLIIYPKQAFNDILNNSQLDNETINDLQELNVDNELSDSKNTLWDNAKEIYPFRNFRKINIAIPILSK